MKVNLVTPFFGIDGFSRHGRNLANALGKKIDLRVDTNKNQGWQRWVNDLELNMLKKGFDPERITIMNSNPPFWRFGLAEKPKKFYGYCIFEGDKVPTYWIEYLIDKRVDGIFVPSSHTKNAIKKRVLDNNIDFSIIEKKIKVIPHGVDLEKYYPEENKNDNLVFTANKGWSKGLHDRGGIQWLLKAYTEEFTDKDDVELSLKINSSYNNKNWNFEEEIKSIGIKKKKNRPKVGYTVETLNDDGLRKFYNSGDVFVSTSMAEAFNLPVLEAMACGLVPLVTKFGGQSDFISRSEGFLIEKGEYLNWSKELMYEGVKWFKPNIKEIRKKMRYIYENQKELKKKSENSIKKAKEYSWDNTAKKILEVLDDK